MPGSTFFVPILAVLSTPHMTFFMRFLQPVGISRSVYWQWVCAYRAGREPVDLG
jgi:hypothetical protein